MPPRRNDGLAQPVAGAGGAAQREDPPPVGEVVAEPAGGLADGEQPEPQAPAAAAPVVEPPFPLLQPGRTANGLQTKLAEIEYDRLPRLVRRKFANLGVNVWNLCCAKNTGYAKHGGLDDPIKRNILEFIGDAASSGSINPLLNAKRMKQIAKRKKEKMAAQIADIILPMCNEAAEEGNPRVSIEYSEAILDDLDEDCHPFDSPESNWWEWLFAFLPSLKESLEEAGFTLQIQPVKPDEDTEAKKQWKEHSVLWLVWS
ncbi:unnamed protein product [Amoebophrya sp. A120]|nr:unnamed protein product [Amoebophrya sp. A120]|eukprot:GSA120T00023377001.1